MTQTTLIRLHPNECTKRLGYYLFAVNLEDARKVVILLSNRVCVPNKRIKTNKLICSKQINDSKILTKLTPNVNATLTVVNVTRIKSGIMINLDVSAKIQKNITHV